MLCQVSIARTCPACGGAYFLGDCAVIAYQTANMFAWIAALKAVVDCRRALVGIIVMVGAGIGSGGTADASCGDYLFRNGRPVREHGQHVAAREQPTESQPVPSGRCHGPNCSSAPLIPADPASPIFVKYRVEHAVTTLSGRTSVELESRRRLTSEAAESADPAEIFHPPERG